MPATIVLMVSPQLLDYIRQQLATGVSKEEIIQALVTTGWQGQDINDAFSTIGTQSAPPQIQETPVATIVQSTVTQNDSPHGRKRWPIILITIVILLLVSGGVVLAAPSLRAAAVAQIQAVKTLLGFSVVSTTTPSVVSSTSITNIAGSSIPTPPITTSSTSESISTTASTSIAGEMPATISVTTNYKGNPLRALVTCKANITKNFDGFVIYYGDIGNDSLMDDAYGCAGPPDCSPPPSNPLTVDKTYTTPGVYTIACVPTYPSTTKISPDSSIAVKKTITIGGYTQPTANDMTFDFQPRSGTLPQQIQSSCSINTTATVSSMGIYVDDIHSLAPGETLSEKFFAMSADSGGGLSHTLTGNGQLPRNNYWIGPHKVYCIAGIGNGTVNIISTPIDINFQ